jgi:hypothetical protein
MDFASLILILPVSHLRNVTKASKAYSLITQLLAAAVGYSGTEIVYWKINTGY